MITELLNKKISMYQNAMSVISGTIYIRDYFNYIKGGEYRDDVTRYRQSVKTIGKDSEWTRLIKTGQLACVTPSGVFRDRKDNGLASDFTGIIVLDLDAKDNIGIDIDEAMLDARDMPNTLAYHKSVSGEGYAIYVYVDKWQKNTYNFVMSYYTVMLGATFDKATCNLSRLRFISSDPDIWIASSVECLEIPPIVERKRKDYVPKNTGREERSDEMIDVLLDIVISNGDDPTSDYADWFTLGCAMANGYGEAGRDMFHKVSSNYGGYDYNEVNKKYDSILQMGEWKANKGSIVFILSQYQ